MQFNQYVWKLYTHSETGKNTLERFKNIEGAKADDSYLEIFLGTGLEGDSEPEVPDEEDIKVIEAVQKFALSFEVLSFEDASRLYTKLIEAKLLVTAEDEEYEALVLDAETIALNINLVSLGLHFAHSEFFIPYGFTTAFYILLQIGDTFSLEIPPVPKKGDFAGKAAYYDKINQSFQDFRKAFSMSPSEICAFLYDFALEFAVDPELPEPSKVWLHSGSADPDFDSLEGSDKSSTHYWGGNLEARRGDIIVMYVVSPYSRIHSIWRAVSKGFIDPFFYFHHTVWIGHPIKTVSISFQEIASHPLLAQNSYVRARLQGPSGKPLNVEEYEAILEMMSAKGQDLTSLPRIPRTSFIPSNELVNERDVEIKLVEPLLENLGYTNKDWLRQMPVRMGRGERKYPDYVFQAKQKRGEESATMVLETKYSISRDKDLREAYFQMRSYALRLQSQKAVLAAREGIWVFISEKGNFSLENHKKLDWLELSNPDVLHKVRQLIGK